MATQLRRFALRSRPHSKGSFLIHTMGWWYGKRMCEEKEVINTLLYVYFSRYFLS